MKLNHMIWIFALMMGFSYQGYTKPKTIKVLIVDGQNNHEQWPKVSYMMKQFLESSGRFQVDVARSAYTWNGAAFITPFAIPGVGSTQDQAKPMADPNFRPNFKNYDVVINNFGWNAAPWPAETQSDFEAYIKAGGGLVVVHAADNSFPEWPAYNLMIGLGGWGNRTEKDGPYIYYDDAGQLIRDTSPGRAGSHGAQQAFEIRIRNAKHPITKGMPSTWMHAKDEMYDRLRGPAQNMEVLATAYSSKDNRGTGRHEPMMMVLSYGKGRIFHTPMGHIDYSVACVGFITTLLRGTEWAATGKVRIPIPKDFPSSTEIRQRPY